MKRINRIIITVSLLTVCAYSQLHAGGRYALIYLDGTVNPVVAEYITESIVKSADEGNSFIILVVDTPGGWMDAMRDIIKSMQTSRIPVVVFTFPKGARAASAGGFIMLASDVAAMAPGTEIGAMHPVNLLPDFLNKNDAGKSGDVMEKKILNDTIAYARSLAQKSGRNADWAARAVSKAESSSYLEARNAGVIEIIANDIDDLLLQLDGRKIPFNSGSYKFSTRGLEKNEYLMTWKQKAVNRIADPQMLFLLFIIAVVGIWAELKNPGMIVPGTAGAVALILFLLGIRVIPINVLGLILIILAFALFILELKFTSFGIFTAGGIISFFIGAVILFDSPLPGGGIPLSTIAAMLIVVLAFVFIVVRAVINVHKGRPVSGREGLIGEEGTVFADFTGRGKVNVHGEIWNAELDGTARAGETIVVDEVRGMLLKVSLKK